MRDLFENDAAARARDEALSVLRGIVARVTGKRASAVTGLAESHISKALSENPGDRYLHDRHIDAILILATPAEISAYWNARIRSYGLKTGPMAPRTAEERLAALEFRVVAKLGQAALEVVEDERSRP